MKTIKKTLTYPCHFGKCKLCNNTGKIKETIYYHIVKGRDNKQYAYEASTKK